jgi:hypothetical protein
MTYIHAMKKGPMDLQDNRLHPIMLKEEFFRRAERRFCRLFKAKPSTKSNLPPICPSALLLLTRALGCGPAFLSNLPASSHRQGIRRNLAGYA